MERFDETYANASIILRPARVAILFRGGERWRGWARLAISIAGKYWGGAGFILVPFQEGGTVAPEVMDVVMRLVLDPERWARNAPAGLVEKMNVGGILNRRNAALFL